MVKKRSKGKGNKSRRRRANVDNDKASTDARRQNVRQELDSVQQLVSDISPDGKDNSEECNCDHGIAKRIEARLPIRLFMLRFEGFVAHIRTKDPENIEATTKYYYFCYHAFLDEACQNKDLSRLKLRADDLEKMTNRFVSLGTDFLSKESLEPGRDLQVAGGLAMLAYEVSKYTGVDGQDFQSYIHNTEASNAQGLDFDNDYLTLLESDDREVARFLSSRTQCSCIPNDLLCNHGFSYPESGDPIYIFREQYAQALEQELEGVSRINYVSIHVNVTRKLEALGLSHLWDNEEERQKMIAYLVSAGTDCVITESWDMAGVYAISAKALEMNKALNIRLDLDTQIDIELCLRVLISQPTMAMFLADLCGDPERQTTKFFMSRNKCSCLKDKYKILKKKGVCNHCCVERDRHELKICIDCKTVNYCSELCQSADWPQHKHVCKRTKKLREHMKERERQEV